MPMPPGPRTLALRTEAYTRLNVTDADVALAPQITPQLALIQKTAKGYGQYRLRKGEERHLPYGPGSDIRTAWPFYLSLMDHPDARRVNSLYLSLPHPLRRATPIEAYCVAASVSPLAILDLLVKAVTRAGAQASAILAAASQPRVVQKNIDMALQDDGLGDRQLFARVTGLLPTPRGAQTIVSVQTNASANAAAPTAVVAPAPEETTRRLAARLSEMRGLPPAPTPEPSIIDMPMPVPARERVPVDADAYSEEDDES